MVDTRFRNLYDVEADGAVYFPVGEVVAGAVDIAAAPCLIDRLIGCAEVIARARFDFYKTQYVFLLRYDIDFPEWALEIAVQYLIAALFQKLCRTAFTQKTKPALLALYCHFFVKLLRCTGGRPYCFIAEICSAVP